MQDVDLWVARPKAVARRALALLVVTAVVVALIGLPTATIAAAPPNDDFDGATVIGSLPYSTSVDIGSATQAADDPYTCSGGGNMTVWYRFTPAATSNVQVTSTTYLVGVFTGARGALSMVACGTMGGAGTTARFTASAGTTYSILIGAMGMPGTPLSVNITVDTFTAPAGDYFNVPLTVPSVPFQATVDNTAATTEPGEPFPCMPGVSSRTVWWTYTASSSGMVTADVLNSSFGDAALNVYRASGPSFGQLSLLQCGIPNMVMPMSLSVAPGQQYYFQAGSTWGGSGQLGLTLGFVAPPPNDEFANATAISSLPFTQTLDTRGATQAPDDPLACGDAARSVWYRFIPTSNMRINLDTSASEYTARASVFVGTRGNLTPVGPCAWPNARVPVSAGVTYWILVSGYGSLGNLVLSVTEAPPPLAIELKLDPTGSVVPSTGTATVHGTLTCNQPSVVMIGGQVQQQIGRATISAWINTTLSCDPGAPTVWSQVLSSPPGAFVGGRAAALFTGGPTSVNSFADAFNFNSGETAHSATSGRVTLQGSRP
jgi:hypothetical protein